MPDLNLKPYSYTEHGRRPLTLAATAIALLLAALALATGAPWWTWIPLGLCLCGCLWLVIRTPVAGTRLTPDTWSFHGANFDRDLPVAEITGVTFHNCSDGPEDIRIHMIDGTVHQPPSMCLPSADALIPELRRARIPVTRH